MFQVYMTIGKQFYITHFHQVEVIEVFNGMSYGMVFDGRSNDMFASKISYRSMDGCIIAFCTTTGKENFSRIGMKYFRH